MHTRNEVTHALVILAYRLKENGDIDEPFIKRMELGVDLWRRGVAPVIILSGWHPMKHPKMAKYCEAEKARAYILSKYGPDVPVFTEPYSRSIPENLLFVRELFPNLRQATVVTAMHALARTKFLGLMAFGDNVKVTYVSCDDGASAPDREVMMLGDVKCVFKRLSEDPQVNFKPGQHQKLLLPAKNGQLLSMWKDLHQAHEACRYRHHIHPDSLFEGLW